MDWFFDGLGTMLLGLVIGGGGGTLLGYRIGIKKTQVQKQRAGDRSNQTMIGRDQVKNSDRNPPNSP